MQNKRQGFTLLELVLVVALVGVVTAVSYSILFAGEKSFEVGVDKGIAQEDQRILREFLVKELRYVSYLKNVEPDEDEYDYYYLLEMESINKNDVNLYQLKKTKYKNGKPKGSTTNSVKMKYFKLVAEGEKVEVNFTSETDNKDYSFTIFFENRPSVGDPLELTPDKKKIYYSYPQYKTD